MTGFETVLYGFLWVASCLITAAVFVAIIVGTYNIVVATYHERRGRRPLQK